MTQVDSGKLLPAATGVATGVLVWFGLSLWFGIDFVPKVESLPTYPPPLVPVDLYASTKPQAAAAASPGETAYQTTCASCHQANGQGLAGAFPPLAGSSWVTEDAETPIRIVLAGLGGPIEVAGQKFNSMMPPPAGLDDEKIAQILTYVRSSFGNKAGAVDKAKVAEVRAALAGRATPWTADELTALRGGSAAPAAPTEGAAPAPTP